MIRTFAGNTPSIDRSVFIAETAAVIGDVIIGSDSSIWYNVVIRGDVNSIRIGCRTNIQDLCLLHVTHRDGPDVPGAPLIIGDDVTVGHHVTLHGCTISNGAFIGMQALVMDHAVIGEGALVGAGSLVTEGTVVPPHTLWLGAPARYRRELVSAEIERLKRSAEAYVGYARQYLSGQP